MLGCNLREPVRVTKASLTLPSHLNATQNSREYSTREPEGDLWSFGTYDPYAIE